jgi:hypothetical protein
MFRPDPNGELCIDEVIADLTALLADASPDSPRAQKLAEIIRGLRGIEDSAPRNRPLGW